MSHHNQPQRRRRPAPTSLVRRATANATSEGHRRIAFLLEELDSGQETLNALTGAPRAISNSRVVRALVTEEQSLRTDLQNAQASLVPISTHFTDDLLARTQQYQQHGIEVSQRCQVD